MKIINPSVELLNPPEYKNILRLLEIAGRVCYKSENKIEENSAENFVSLIITLGHESVLEHISLSVRFVCDRGVSHEIVRHRLASYSQESTRYCNYSQDKFNHEITVIKPVFMAENTFIYHLWKHSCELAEMTYFDLLDKGCTAQEARTVLPNSLKTELTMTANIREWRYFLKLRTGSRAHPQMRQLTIPLLDLLQHKYPVLFNGI